MGQRTAVIGEITYGILWTGCNLTIYHLNDARVTRQIEFARKSYEVGTPAFGTCWGSVQMAAVAAGGEVRANPRGNGLILTERETADRSRGHIHVILARGVAMDVGKTNESIVVLQAQAPAG